VSVNLTEAIVRAASQDAANAQMRAAGRSKWSREDYNLAVETFNRLWPNEPIQKDKRECLSRAATTRV